MINYIENGFLKVGVKNVGAEFASMIDKRTTTEFVWHGDENVWINKGKNCFPVCGVSENDQIIVDGQSYPMPMHGLAKTYKFELVDKTSTFMSFMMVSNEETKKYYPYDFEFFINYELKDQWVYQTFKIVNTSDVDMYFQVGGHTGFNLPINGEGTSLDYELVIDKKLKERVCDGQLTGEEKDFINKTGKIVFDNTYFDNGSKELFGFARKKVRLQSKKYGYYLEARFNDFDNLVLWCRPGEVEYLAIEPWMGAPDVHGFTGELKDRPCINVIKPNSIKEYTQSFRCGKDKVIY